MAVPGKLLTLKGVKDVADWGQELNLMDIPMTSSETDIIEKTREKMEQYIEQAEVIERRILETFGIDATNVEEGQQILQQKFIEKLEGTGLITLSGSQLRTNVLNAYETRKKAENDEFEQWVQTKFKEEVQKKIGEATKEVIKNEWDSKAIMSVAIIKALDIGKGNIVIDVEKGNIGGKAKRGILYKAGTIITKELSKNRYENLRELYKIDTGKVISANPTSKITTKEETQDELSESLEVNVDVNYYGATGGKRASDLSKLSPEQKKKQLELIKQSLKNEIMKSVSGEYAYTAYMILDRMLEKNVENFLVGDNVSDITGILGEFRAAVALTLLLPNVDLNSIIEWVAKEKVDNTKQLSADFLLRTATGLNIGIQVKNSAQDLDNLTKQYEIHFVDASINNIFDKLGKKYPIFEKGSRGRMISKLIYISSSFNVPYKGKWENGKLIYINGDTAGKGDKIETFEGYEDFCKTRDIIKDIKEKIDLFLKMFTPDFLFMATDENFKNALATLDTETAKLIQGNNLYIIGNKPLFVSTILRKILNKIYELDIQVSAKTIIEKQKLIDDGFLVDKGDKTFEGGNIVDYLNEFSTAEGGVDWKKIRKVSKNQNYQMTSSLLLS